MEKKSNKLKKYILILLVALSAITACKRLEPIYLVGFGGNLKIPVPLKIRLTRDCEAYAKFVEKNIGPMFLPNPRNCPWKKVDGSKDGIFTIKNTDVTFRIPRKYLVGSERREPNGVTEGILMELEYPSMEPADWSKENVKVQNSEGIAPKDNFVMILFGYRPEEDHKQEELDHYLHFSGIKYYLEPRTKERCLNTYKELSRKSDTEMLEFCLDQAKKKTHLKYKPQKIKHLPEFNLTKYTNDKKDIYVRGDVYNPDYWVLCDQEKYGHNYCERTEFLLDDKPIDFNYRFHRKALLKHHDDIQKKVKEKLKEFIINQPHKN